MTEPITAYGEEYFSPPEFRMFRLTSATLQALSHQIQSVCPLMYKFCLGMILLRL